MQNLSIPTVVLTTLAQWQTYYISFFERISALHQARKISTAEHKMVTAYLDNLNQAFKYYFSLKTLSQQTEHLQTLLDELQIFAKKQNDSPFISESLADLKATLIATKEELLKPMAIEKLPPEILNRIASDNFTSRETLNLAQCSSLLFFGDAGLSFLAKYKRLPELSKFRFTVGERTSFLSFENQLFVWGRNARGQLGLGDNCHRKVPVEFDLTRLQLASEDGMAQIIAGQAHNILLTQQGRCFVWGHNGFGLLGLGDNVGRNVPVEFDLTCLQLASGDGVAQVVTGWKHTILFTRQGRCFVWGSNSDGELGLGDNRNRNVPVEFDLTRLQLAPEDGVAQIVAVGYRSILITRQGRYFLWGKNIRGINHSDRNVPVEFNLTRLQLGPGDGAAQVIASAWHNILVTRQGRCFVWGSNNKGQLGLGNAADKYGLTTATEVFYPHLKELKNLWSSFQNEDLASLASLASNKSIDGQTAYQLILKRLAFENIKTRLCVIPLIYDSPWHELSAVTELLPFASLYPLLIEIVRGKPRSEHQPIVNALAKLLEIFNYFIDKEPSAEQMTRQKDFIELLKTLEQGKLQDYADLSEYLERTATSLRLKNFSVTFFNETVFALSFDLQHLTTRYFNVRQALLTEAKQQPEFLSHLTAAAGIIMQGLNVATEADGMAYTLRAIFQPELLQPKPTRPGAGLCS